MVIKPAARDTDGTSMRRPLLLTLIALGSLVCLIGGTGLFAALTDTARTGTNTVDSAALAPSADIQLATATGGSGSVTCGTFSEDLSTAFFTVLEVEAGWGAGPTYFCIKNVGSQAVSLSASVDELVDTDIACTGDEALYDTTCGGNLLGELSSVLTLGYSRRACSSDSELQALAVILKDNATTAVSFTDTLAAGATGCFSVFIVYPTTRSATEIQQAQSDRATWRFKFTAQA